MTNEVLDLTETTLVSLSELRSDLSPRRTKLDPTHVSALAEVLDETPPILVTNSLVVVDGMHRISAALKLGRTTIKARVFRGTDDEAIAEAVRANIRHGKPLSLAEKESVARVLLSRQPGWSDRLLSQTCGLSPSTVARLRRSTESSLQSNKRVGRDGRSRPSDPVSQRIHIAELLAADAAQTLRSVAETVGASPATVLDVRNRLRAGDNPVPARYRSDEATELGASRAAVWQHDAALATDASTRDFVAWIHRVSISDRDWIAAVPGVPLSRVYELADEARQQAASWSRLADALSARPRTGKSDAGHG